MRFDWFPSKIRAISGGTRVKINLNRPWQMPVLVQPEKCKFREGVLKEEEIVERYCDGKWLSIVNIFTPFDSTFHRMLIPKECLTADKLSTLGGRKEIVTAVGLIENIIAGENRKIMHVSVHSGPLAGQNILHLHYHIFDPAREDVAEFIGDEKKKLRHVRATIEHDSRTVFKEKNVIVVAGGHRAGQCYLFVDGKFDHISFGEALHRLIMLYIEKFTSAQGLPPEYGVAMIFEDGVFHHATTVPVLNQWGACEYIALFGGGVITIPWSHEATASYLRGVLE